MKILLKKILSFILIISIGLLISVSNSFAGGGGFMKSHVRPQKLPANPKILNYSVAPFGSYNSIRLMPFQPEPEEFSCGVAGLVIYRSDTNQLEYCTTRGWRSATTDSTWTRDAATGNNYYLTDTTSPELKRIGIATGLKNCVITGWSVTCEDRNPPFKLSIGGGDFNSRNMGGLSAVGTLGQGTNLGITPSQDYAANTNATHFIWYPRKAAFRAGRIKEEAITPLEFEATYWNDANIGNVSVALGVNPLVAAPFSSVTGGEKNRITVNSSHSYIGGGKNNFINTPAGTSATQPPASTIIGGENNSILSRQSFIAGGLNNSINASSDLSIVAGGESNRIISSPGTTILGGENNYISNSTYATLGAGEGFALNDLRPSITNSPYASMLAGKKNYINESSYATIGSGEENIISYAPYGVVMGGDRNQLIGMRTKNANHSVIVGGQRNHYLINDLSKLNNNNFVSSATVMGSYSFIGGGLENYCYGSWSAIIGGKNNTIKGDYSIIGGGGKQNSNNGNEIHGDYAGIAGGKLNKIGNDGNNEPHNLGNYSFIGAGENNLIEGQFSTILGGIHNEISENSQYSFVYGSNMQLGTRNNPSSNTFVWGVSDSAYTMTNKNDMFLVFPKAANPGRVGIGTTAPAATLHVKNGDVKISNGDLTVQNLPLITAASGRNNLYYDGNNFVGKDMAEIFPASEEVEIGDVVVADDKDFVKVKKSNTPYDKKVIGIVSAAPAILFEGSSLQVSPQPFEFKKGLNPPIALTGRVLCKVSLENGPIEPGDLLTTSSTAGHAMKADRDVTKSQGTIVGRALQGFSETNNQKTGLITVMVTLH